AVATALHYLVIVALLGADVAEARPRASDVGDHTRQLCAGHVADPLLHQADAGAARGRHNAHTRRRPAVQHVDGRDLTLCLHIHAAGFGHKHRCGLGDLAGRGNGIAVERPASGQDGAFDDGLVALHQLFLHAAAPPTALVAFTLEAPRLTRRNTVMAPGSGHAMKQIPQAVQPRPRYDAVR